MKKLLIIVCMVIMSIAIHATNIISLTSVEGKYNDEVQVDVSLENSDAITAVEITIPLDKNLTYVNASAVMNSVRSNGHLISAAEVDNELRIYIYSLSLGTLKGNEGVLCSFKLKLKREPAVYTLMSSVVLGDAAGNSLAVEAKSATVTILAPKLEIQTKDIDFGHIPIRSTYTRSVTLRNLGTVALSVSSITIDDEDFEFSETAFTIAVGETKNITLQYAPLNRGAISRTISVESDAMNGVQKATVVADPFSVNELHIAQVSGIADSIVAVPITMNNMEPIVGAQFSFKLPEALVYDGVELSERATDHIAFGTMYKDTLTVMLYSPTNAPLNEVDGKICDVKFRLNGTSGYYYLKPLNTVLSNVNSINMVSAVSQGRVQIKSPKITSNASLTMPLTAVTNVATASYSIRNNGQAPLTIERVTFLAEGYRVVDELPLVIEASKTKNIIVEYTPTVEGKYSTTMNVYTNDPNNRMKNVEVSGEIYEPNSLSLSGQPTADGYVVNVAMDNYSDIVAMQFDVHWVEGMTTDASKLQATSRLSGHTASITKIGDVDYRVVVFSMTNAAIAGHNGDVISLVFKGLSPAEYNNSSIVVDNIMLSNSKSVNKVSTLTTQWNVNLYSLALGVNDDNMGSVVGDAGFYELGSEVTISAVAKPNHHFVRWSDGSTEAMRTISVTSNISLTAEFAINVYTVAVSTENGTVTGDGECNHGTEVTLTATPNEGYHFVKWSDGETTPTRTITVTDNVTLTAEFAINIYTVTLIAENGTVTGAGEYEHGIEVTLTATPNEGYHFVKWSDGDTNPIRTITVTDNVTLTAEFVINIYTVTLIAENGIVTGAGEYEHGTEVSLTATPNEGYHFVKWSDGETTPTRTITVTDNVTLTAEFAINVYTVTLTAENGTVTGDGEYNHGTEVTLTATPAEGYHFVKWSDGNTNATRSITVTSNITLTAEFAINVYTVTLTAENGIVTGAGEYVHGTEVTLTASPNEGYHFVKWSDGDTNPTRTITVTDNVTLTAEFAINVYTVTLTAENGTVTGAGEYEHGQTANITVTPAEGYHFVKWSDGDTNPTRTITVTDNVTLTAEFAINVYTVTLSADNGTVTGAGEYEHGQTANITATPAEGYHFVKWSDGDTNPTRTITVTDNVTLTAEFAINVYTVTLIAENGTVTGAGEYEHGTEVTLTATPNEGYHFVKWSDGETTPTRTITVTDNVTLTAEFAINVYTVTLTSENGTVTGDGEYNHGTEVTLTATPNEGYHFVKWSDGDTNPTRTITVTDNVTLTAEFAINVYIVTLTAENGTVTGAGEYEHGTEVTLTATPNEGYHFVKWSDGVIEATRTITVIADVTLTAEFELDALVEVDDVVESHIIAYSHNQTLYVEGVTGDYYVLDMTGNVVYYGQLSVVPLPCGVYMIVADGERHKVMVR